MRSGAPWASPHVHHPHKDKLGYLVFSLTHSGQVLLDDFDLLGASNEERAPLVDLVWDNVQDPASANGPRRVRLVSLLHKVHVVLEAVRPALEVALVEGVDLPALGDLDVVVAKDKVADERVQSETVDAVPNGENEDGGGAVHDVPGGEEVLAGPAAVEEGLLLGDVQVVAVRALSDDALALQVALLVGLEDAKDAADGDARVDVGAPVEGVEANDVVAAVGLVDGHGNVLLLAGDGPGPAAVLEAIGEDVVGDDVELLLVLPLNVLLSRESSHALEARPSDQRADLLARQRYGVQHDRHLVRHVALHLLLEQPRREGHGSNHVLLDRDGARGHGNRRVRAEVSLGRRPAPDPSHLLGLLLGSGAWPAGRGGGPGRAHGGALESRTCCRRRGHHLLLSHYACLVHLLRVFRLFASPSLALLTAGP